MDPIGTGAMGSVDLTDAARNNTWHTVINTIGASTPGANMYTLRVNALQCPLSGCPLPPPPVSAGRV